MRGVLKGEAREQAASRAHDAQRRTQLGSAQPSFDLPDQGIRI